MNAQGDNQIGALESRINDLRRDIDELLASTSRRTGTMRVVLIIICVAMIGYLSFIYNQLATVDADLVASLAHAEVQKHIEDGGRQLATQLNSKAPEIFDDLESRAMAIPDDLAAQGRSVITQQMDQAIPAIEDDMIAKMIDLIDRLADKAYETNEGDMTEGDFQQLIDAVADEFVNDTMAMIDSLHAKYQSGSNDVLEYLSSMGDDPKTMDARRRHHRAILLAALAVIEKRAEVAAAEKSAQPQLKRPAPK